LSEKVSESVKSAETLRIFIDSAAVYAYVADSETDEILMVNSYYAEHLGVPAEMMEGRKCWEFVNGEEGRCGFCPRGLDPGKDGFLGGSPCAVEAFNPTLGIWGKWTAREIAWADGRKAHIMMIVDVSEEKLLREELSRLAYYDKRMGIPNRAKFEKDISERPGGNYCVIAYEYTSLRDINDAYGRALVNAMFEAVIGWIRSLGLQQYDVYRTDNNEFCVLLDNVDNESAGRLADRFAERFTEPWDVSSMGESTSISCRAAICAVDGRAGFGSAETLLATIGRTLDIAKESKRVTVYDKDLGDALNRDFALGVSLKECVQNDMEGFEVYYQPIVDPNRGVWVGLEAFCRWTSPEFGRIPPLVFIHMAEQIGVSNRLGYWVLNTAIAACAELGLNLSPGFFVGVNLSPSQMNDEALITKVLMSLEKHKFPAECLSLEVTESQNLEETGYSHTTIERLVSLDVKVAIDDFGTGHSNFYNLRNLPVQILKIEKSFIDNIEADDYQKFLTKTIVDLAHETDMKLISEGVETPEQMKELLKNKADYLQGYLFARPLSMAELAGSAHRFREPDPMFAIMKGETDG